MRIVFLGTPDFAVASLAALVENGHEVVGVVTAPDKPAGRGQKLQQSAVKSYATEQGLYVMQPEKLKSPDFINELASLKADLHIVVAFRMLPEMVWNMPPLGTFNLHASLLPQYRGAAPINWAVINGEKETGVTTFFLKHEIDTGEVIFQRKVDILNTMSAGELHDVLMKEGAGLVIQTVEAIQANQYQAITQEKIIQEHGIQTNQLKHAPKIFKADCQIDWQQTSSTIYNLIRGLSPYPSAYTQLVQKNQTWNLKIYQVSDIQENKNLLPGRISSDGKSYIWVGTSDGVLSIAELQLEGKKRMKTEEFLRGFKIEDDSYLQ